MSVTFIHSADWQLGKPYGSVPDIEKRSKLQQERLRVVDRIRGLVEQHGARFVVLAGDVFDSPSPSKPTVSAGCAAIGKLQVPVYLIPGNHDHGGPLGLWDQPFFAREREELAPNLHVLLKPEPVEIDDAVLLPCPLLRRHEALDLTAWLRSIDGQFASFGAKPRIIIAHGSVQGFGMDADDDDGGGAPNQIDLSQLSDAAFDYIALGDWHGAKQVGAKAWYSGTPELDRFPKGADYGGGQTLVVTASRGQLPIVLTERTAHIGWHGIQQTFLDDADLVTLGKRIDAIVGTRVGEDMLRLELSGTLGIGSMHKLDDMLDAWQSRLLRVKLANKVTMAATAEDILALTQRVQDPLIARVATLLAESLDNPDTEAIGRVALRELYAATH